jgi:hypothetical protein
MAHGVEVCHTRERSSRIAGFERASENSARV